MRLAAVYQTKDELILCSNAKTTDGLWLSIPPYIHLDKNASDEQIALAIREIIDANQFNVDHPKQNEWSEFIKRHLERLGVKSMSALHKKAIYCSIEEYKDNLRFLPSKNEGVKGGFAFIPDSAIVIPATSSSGEVATALKDALRVSQQWG